MCPWNPKCNICHVLECFYCRKTNVSDTHPTHTFPFFSIKPSIKFSKHVFFISKSKIQNFRMSSFRIHMYWMCKLWFNFLHPCRKYCGMTQNVPIATSSHKHFTIGPNEQNQHFAELLRQKVFLYICAVVLQIGLSNLDGKLKRFDTKKWKKQCAKLKSDRL